MEFSKNKKLLHKNFLLICALTLFTALAATGCGSSDTQNITGEGSDITATGPQATTGNEPVVDPGPGGGGGVKPELGDVANVDVAVLDDSTDPQPPPPPPGGGGGLGDSQPDKCLSDEPFSGRRKNVSGTTAGDQADVLDQNNCIII